MGIWAEVIVIVMSDWFSIKTVKTAKTAAKIAPSRNARKLIPFFFMTKIAEAPSFC